jgi:hypothetical protein
MDNSRLVTGEWGLVVWYCDLACCRLADVGLIFCRFCSSGSVLCHHHAFVDNSYFFFNFNEAGPRPNVRQAGRVPEFSRNAEPLELGSVCAVLYHYRMLLKRRYHI